MYTIPFSLVLGGLLIRLGLALFSPEVADVANYRRVAEILQQGGQLYTNTPSIYPYPPLWALIEIVALWLSQHSPLPFAFWVELCPILADSGIVYLLYLFTRNPLVPALYAFNPLPILICVVHGQFDALPIFFSLLALYVLQKQKPYQVVALALLIAIALKSYPVLLIPFFLMRLENWRQRLIFSTMTLLPVLVSIMPFLLSDSVAVSRELFGYSGYPDHGWLSLVWGLLKLVAPQVGAGAILQVATSFSKVLFLVGYVALLYLSYRKQKLSERPPLTLEIALIFALFYALYGGLSSQYLIWILPFLLLLNLSAATTYSLLATFALLAFYNYQWPSMIYRTASLQFLGKGSALLWLACTGIWWLWVIIWLVMEFRTYSRLRVIESAIIKPTS